MFTSTPVRRFLSSIALALVAWLIAFLGRIAINELVVFAPQWTSEIERFGGFVVGLLVVVATVVPILKIYGFIEAQRKP